jgi:hypothetical protein
VFPLEQWLIIFLHITFLIARNDFVSQSSSTSPISAVQSFRPPVGVIAVRSNSIDSADVWVLSASLVCLSVSSPLGEVVVSFTMDVAAKDVPRFDMARMPTSARRLRTERGMHFDRRTNKTIHHFAVQRG